VLIFALMPRTIRMLWLGGSLLCLAGCSARAPVARRRENRSVRFIVPAGAPVITQATVVAFWLASADSIPERSRPAIRDGFRRSNVMIAKYLSDTDIQLVATVTDTVVIQLANGVRRIVQLTGLDFPYGYVLIDPGYAEEFHTGLPDDDDLRDALDDYFGLESDAPGPRHRIASSGPRVTLVRR
jgi:hypothetical protein